MRYRSALAGAALIFSALARQNTRPGARLPAYALAAAWVIGNLGSDSAAALIYCEC